MGPAATARLLAQGALWRATGLKTAGRALISALGSEDEDVRAAAGMLLVKAGKRAVPLLREALLRRENLPMVLSILGDLGDRESREEVARLAGDPDPRVAKAARDALRLLSAR
ncbi:MAG TPA: hypothetical protein VFN71_10360 [Methylomirabilota bacterium]|nr:hypothetical protein [Methylomirabilota bacterium]